MTPTGFSLSRFAFRKRTGSVGAQTSAAQTPVARTVEQWPRVQDPPKIALRESAKKRGKRVSHAVAAEEPVPDNMDTNLNILFVGINPGLQSAAKGHHYAGSNNHFWKCLSNSGLVPEPLTYLDDHRMPAFGFGMTNIVSRRSASSSDLSLAEIRQGVPVLTKKIEATSPLIVCFNGKGIYEVFSGAKCNVGLQPDSPSLQLSLASPGRPRPRFFVMPSSSGRVSSYQYEDKLQLFVQLKRLLDEMLQTQQSGK